jgi:hypothetical protein
MTALSPKRLIQFETFEQIKSRSAFKEVVNTKEVTPQLAVGVYKFPEDAKQPCGLSDCRTPHSKGFLVVMNTGDETLVGSYCGAKKMGLLFQEILNRGRAEDRLARDLEIVNLAIDTQQSLLERIQDLLDREFGGKWLGKRLARARSVMPPEALHTLGRMARRSEPELFTLRRLTEKEVEIRQQTGAIPRGESGPFFDSAIVGRVSGLPIWANDLRALLIDELQSGVMRLSKMPLIEKSPAQTSRDAKWIRSIPAKFAEAESILADGVAFFAPENLRLLTNLGTLEQPIKGLYDGIEQLIRS